MKSLCNRIIIKEEITNCIMPVTSKETRRKVDESLIPQNVEAEEAVLGAILVNPETLAKVSDTLLPKSFYKPAHRYIYEAMLQLFNNNDNIDIVTVSEVLNYSGKLDAVAVEHILMIWLKIQLQQQIFHIMQKLFKKNP